MTEEKREWFREQGRKGGKIGGAKTARRWRGEVFVRDRFGKLRQMKPPRR